MQSVSLENRLVFEANRAAGHLAFSVAASNGRTSRRDVREQGPLRVRFPNTDSDALEAIIVNTAGGIAGGDALSIDVSVGENAKLVLGTAAAEKVYRSHGPDARLALNLEIASGGQLAWLPQETIMFDRARLSRRIDVALASNASAVVVESIVFGRSAMGESVAEGLLCDRWRVRLDGQLVFAESTRLSGVVSERLSQPAVANGGGAVAMVLIAPGDPERVERVRGCSGLAGTVGISAWNGIAVARFCATDGAALRSDLINVLAALSMPLPRLWLQ